MRNPLWPALLLLVSACAHQKYAQLPAAGMLQKDESRSNLLVYRNQEVERSKYNRIILEPVEIYAGEDNGFGLGVSEEEKREMAGYLSDQVASVLGAKQAVCKEPAPDALRLKLTLAGLEKTRPFGQSVTYVLPVGLALNLAKGALGKSGTLMGSATVAGEFYDSKDGTLVGAFLAKTTPNALDATVAFTWWDAAKKGIRNVASGLGELIDQVRSRHQQKG
jgi:hypothetical protein